MRNPERYFAELRLIEFPLRVDYRQHSSMLRIIGKVEYSRVVKADEFLNYVHGRHIAKHYID